MLGGPIGTGKGNSLMSDYSLKLGEAVLRSRMLEAERNARLESEIAAKIKSEFISNMSHELRTPLNTVIGFSKLLTEHEQRPLPGEEVVEYARLINDAAGNLLAIINDILDMSKIQSGQFRLDAGEACLDEIIESVVMGLRPAAREAGVELGLELPSETIMVRGDADKLQQIFVNLIGNAVKFTSSGGHVRVAAQVAKDRSVSVDICDNGIGMDADEVQVALAPFGQVDGTRTRWREGTGLGLPIAKALIELHGGTIEIKSEKSKGTEVAVRLPSPEFAAFLKSNNLGIPKDAA
jgi:two-component system cell cycle sensor histidine kinase PleC